jgi:hypothetical protein
MQRHWVLGRARLRSRTVERSLDERFNIDQVQVGFDDVAHPLNTMPRKPAKNKRSAKAIRTAINRNIIMCTAVGPARAIAGCSAAAAHVARRGTLISAQNGTLTVARVAARV